MITLDSWGGYPDSTFISGNIFYAPESSRFQLTESTHNFFEGNYYLGRFEKLPEDGKACQSAEIYQKEVLAKDENGYQGLALLMDTVEVTAPVACGQVILADIGGTGINFVASRDM